jgi:hypothetical protein
VTYVLAFAPIPIPSLGKGAVSESSIQIFRESVLSQEKLMKEARIGKGFSPNTHSIRQINNCCHVWVQAEPKTDHKQKFAEINIVPLRPRKLLSGSENQQPRALPR